MSDKDYSHIPVAARARALMDSMTKSASDMLPEVTFAIVAVVPHDPDAPDTPPDVVKAAQEATEKNGEAVGSAFTMVALSPNAGPGEIVAIHHSVEGMAMVELAAHGIDLENVDVDFGGEKGMMLLSPGNKMH